MMKLLSFSLPGANGEPILIQPPGGIPTGGFTDAMGNTILGFGLNLTFVIAVILVLFYLVYGGIQWITSQGDKQKVAAARNRITYAIIGLLIIAFSGFIVNVILYFFGATPIGK